MKNLILCFIFVVAGALMLTATNGFASRSYCTSQDPNTTINCAGCHGGNSYCDQCPNEPACAPTPTPPPTCANDNDGDGYLGEPGNTSCADCDDSDASVNPDATEDCVDGIDNDCNGAVDCDDSYCDGDPACWLANCVDYNNPKDREGCKNNPNCNWSGKNGCAEIPAAQSACQEAGGRWNKKKGTCTTR